MSTRPAPRHPEGITYCHNAQLPYLARSIQQGRTAFMDAFVATLTSRLDNEIKTLLNQGA